MAACLCRPSHTASAVFSRLLVHCSSIMRVYMIVYSNDRIYIRLCLLRCVFFLCVRVFFNDTNEVTKQPPRYYYHVHHH